MKRLKELYYEWRTRRLRSALQKKTTYLLQSLNTLVEEIRFHRQFPESPTAVANLKKSIEHLDKALSALEKGLPNCEPTFCQNALLRLRVLAIRLSVADIR